MTHNSILVQLLQFYGFNAIELEDQIFIRVFNSNKDLDHLESLKEVLDKHFNLYELEICFNFFQSQEYVDVYVFLRNTPERLLQSLFVQLSGIMD